jgi:anti-sigma28 factor (negative regulator of flagellin synthesis)
MPKGERQTTGTAQALLGAKQIAAQERASKRATVADYVKTGVGALKSVGDYLQQKQSLEQSQEKLTLEQSMFTAQFGPEEEWKPRRDVRTRYEEAIAQQQEAKGKFADPLAAAETKTATAGASVAEQIVDPTVRTAVAGAGTAEAGQRTAEAGALVAEGTVDPQIELVTEQARGASLTNTSIEIENKYRPALAAGQIDQVRASAAKLKAEAKTVEERRKVDIAHGWAIIRELESTGEINKKKLKMLESKHLLETDPKERAKNLTANEARLQVAQIEVAEADAKVAKLTVESRVERLADLVKEGKLDIDSKKLAKKMSRLKISREEVQVAIDQATREDRIREVGIDVETKSAGLVTVSLHHRLMGKQAKTEGARAELIASQALALGAETTIAFERLALDRELGVKRVGLEEEKVGLARGELDLKERSQREGIDLDKARLRLDTWVADVGYDAALKRIDIERQRSSDARLRDIDNFQLANRGLGLDMLKFELSKRAQGHTEEESRRLAARFSLEHKSKYGSPEYQKELQQAILATEKAKPGQEGTRAALIQAQTTAIEMENRKKANQLLGGLNDLQVEEKDKKILHYTKLAKRLPQFRPEMSGAEKELKAQNLQGPNTVFMDQISALVDDGVTTAGKLSGDHYNALTEEEGFWSGVVSGSMPGTSLVADLGSQYYNLPQDQQEKFVEWLAREWPEGTKKLFELGDVRQSWWSRKWRGFGPAKGLENIGAALGSGAQTYEDEFQLEMNFLHGLAAGMNAVQKGGRPSDASNFREFQAVPMSPRGMGALDIGLPSERVRAPIPE